MERDPRISPVNGDVVRNPHGVEFYVRDSDQHTVTYQENGAGDLLVCDLNEWREFAITDTVIQRGAA